MINSRTSKGKLQLQPRRKAKRKKRRRRKPQRLKLKLRRLKEWKLNSLKVKDFLLVLSPKRLQESKESIYQAFKEVVPVGGYCTKTCWTLLLRASRNLKELKPRGLLQLLKESTWIFSCRTFGR